MFLRKKRNKSGSVSVQVIDKSSGYRVLYTAGSAKKPEEIRKLTFKAERFMAGNQTPLFSFKTKEDTALEGFIKGLSNAHIRTIGPELIFGTVFDRIGFNVIPEELFRHIVIARLAYPTSKVKTADYLFRYRGVSVSPDEIYRFLDRLNKKYKAVIEKITYEHTKKTLGSITVVFYDMTTLYFESENEDDLRKIGFSKDGKFQCPQIMLGLLVGQNGFPIGYDLFEGNTFEGKTLVPTLQALQKRYGFDKPTVVADAGLLSKENIKSLQEEGYRFILGARIKNESRDVQQKILEQSSNVSDGSCFIIEKSDSVKLIVNFSEKRKRKDAHNREKGLRKLKEKIQSGKLTKAHINNRGYNKFLSLSGEVAVTLNTEKISEDECWDGLKGYLTTDTDLDPKRVLEEYRHLWMIERAFRISKTDLRARPIFHYKRKRIESHLCIVFVAYAVWKELERILKSKNISMSPERAAELTHTMYAMEYVLPDSEESGRAVLKMDGEQELLRESVSGED